MAGKTVRRPGLFMRVDEGTNEDTDEPLLRTNETIHSSVRVRLACGGLGLDDKDVWTCDSLLRDDKGRQPLWRLEKGSALSPAELNRMRHFVPREITLPSGEYPKAWMYDVQEGDSAWRWVYEGKVKGGHLGAEGRVPSAAVLPEEPLCGYWERYLLGMLSGEADVWRFAQRVPTGGIAGMPRR